MKIYGDLETDEAQTRVLENVWRCFALLGMGFVAVDVVELASTIFLNGNAIEFRPPVLAVLGAFLCQSALKKIAALKRGEVVAVAGDCPSCGERVFIFLPGNEGARVTRGSECHVCERSVSFRADVRVEPKSRYGRGATGRVYLATRADDYYSADENDPNARDQPDAWPPRNAENTR